MKISPSYYLKAYPWERDSDRLLLFSTKNASSILISKKTYQSMQEGGLSASDAATLEGLQMLVGSQEAEKKAMLSLIDELNPKSTGMNAIVVLNLDCNFACPYCFEGSIKGKHYMTSETAERLVSFIDQALENGKDTLVVDFYGGEPLLSLDLIVSISERLGAIAEARSASYGFTLVTNGSLFTAETARKLVGLGLKSVKITLDGPAEVHNRSRPFKSGAGSFDTIVKNIKDTCDLVKVGIGGNFTEENYAEFPLLLDYLQQEGLTPDRLYQVKFDPVIKHPKAELSPSRYTQGCISIDEPWVRKAETVLRDEILKRGYHTPKPAPMVCMIENESAYVVDYDGTFYKCPGFIGVKAYGVGSLTSGIRDYGKTLNIGLYRNDDCAECVYLPLCFGGCRYMAYLEDGNVDSINCKKAYYDASLETLIKQDILYRGPKQTSR